MTLFPRSLFGRNVLLIVVLVVVGQLASALLVRQLIVKPRLAQLSVAVARNVGAIRAGLAAMPPAQREAFVAQFNRRAMQGIADDEEGGGRGQRPLLSRLERRFVNEASRGIALEGEGSEIIWRREAGGSLAVRLRLDGADHWVTLPGVLPAREFTGAWIAASLTSALLALLGALLIHRHLNRPLRRVVASAHTLAGGGSPQPLPEDGPTEIADLSRSFNQMVRSLAQADDERALMLAGVSHDLRTPLTKLRLGIEILREKADEELMARMTRGVEEMDAIIGQFLDFARSTDSEAPVPVSLDALAAEVAAASAGQGMPVALEAGNAPPVPLRPRAMRRVLTNLVENAWRHGLPPVVIATGSSGDSAWIEVTDHGTGIAAAQAEALKQPFRRAESTRGGPPGAGLGLAIVDRIVRVHGGRFELLPAASGGLCARISLPRA
ncbi:signal transduction histidine kinase [Polaromonas sp. CF318]|uniref:ATP-binding protein n=1 Tax=Polaromonas sp. CF318 TaxID=1144318 RepID=UPI0002710187|nr:ATP-binding protein [Polaromonas sp. CF318]EJL80621.1 signal transduction histidine kinase [Polaromonas sp. CF318]